MRWARRGRGWARFGWLGDRSRRDDGDLGTTFALTIGGWRSGDGNCSIVLADSAFFVVKGQWLIQNRPPSMATQFAWLHSVNVIHWAAPGGGGRPHRREEPAKIFSSFDYAREKRGLHAACSILGALASSHSYPPWVFLGAQVRARARLRVGRCGQCGYDRRGIADSLPCPECGQGDG